MLAWRLTFTSEWNLGFVEGGIISGSDAVHIKALVMSRVVVNCIGIKQLSFLGGLKLQRS